MGLRSLLHVAGACLGVLLGSSAANAAYLAGTDASGPTSLDWSSLGRAGFAVGGPQPVSTTDWATPPLLQGASGAEQQTQTITWVARPDGTAGGMRLEFLGWAATADGTSGLHLPLDVLRADEAPVPLPATFWLFGSGALAAMLAFHARRPVAARPTAFRHSRAR
jgi:hypothetical protein